jgi:hypothetical protein
VEILLVRPSWGDTEVFQRALGLRSPQPVSWDLDFAKRVFLYSNICIIHIIYLFGEIG